MNNNWFSIDQIGRIQIELSDYCNAACPQCDRAELFWASKKDNSIVYKLNSRYFTLSEIQGWFSPYDWSSLKMVHYCGNVDEPTTNPEMIEITKFFLSLSNKCRVEIATNGGTRDEKFWKELGKLSKDTGRILVHFALDGLEDTNHIYRKNVNWTTTQRNFRSYIAAGGMAAWQFIVFSHNKHQLTEAKAMSDNEGFARFNIIESGRNDIDEQVEVSIEKVEVPEWYSTNNGDKINGVSLKEFLEENNTFSCVRCPAKLKSGINKFDEEFGNIYISAAGYVVPCCWMGNPLELIKLWNSNTSLSPTTHNLHNATLESIINSDWWDYINNVQNDYELCIQKCKELRGDKHI